MKKVTGIACVCGLFALASVAYGATRLDFNFCPGVYCIDTNVDGMAVLNYVAPKEETVLQVILSGLQAQTMTLEVVACFATFEFDVDSTGAYTIHERISGDCSGSVLILSTVGPAPDYVSAQVAIAGNPLE